MPRAESTAMRPPRVRFTIRWLMETTILVAIALWILRASPAALFLVAYLSILYVFGLAPMRRLYRFAPIRRLLAGWSRGYLPEGPEGRARDDRRAGKDSSLDGAGGRSRVIRGATLTRR